MNTIGAQSPVQEAEAYLRLRAMSNVRSETKTEFKWVGRPKTTDKPRRSGDVVRQGPKARLLIN